MNNNIKKLSALLLVSLFIVSCSSKKGSSSQSSGSSSITSSETTSEETSSEESSAQENEFVTATAPFYTPTYQNGDFISKETATFDYAYYSDEPAFVYMSIDEVLSYLFTNNYTEEISTNFYTYETTRGLKITLDAIENTMTFVKYDEVNLFSLAYDCVPLGNIDEEHTLGYVKPNGTFNYGENVVFDLEAYHLDLVEKDSKVYVPFSIINQVFFTNTYYSGVAYNGNGFYLIDLINGAFSLSGGSNYSYTYDYYHGPFRGKKRSEKFTEDNYNAFMFQLDHFYGFLDERMVPFESYLTENYPEIIDDLKNTDHATYTKAVNRIMEEVIGDGHTNSGKASTIFGTGTVNSQSYYSDRSIELNNAAYACYYARQQSDDVTDDIVRFKNNTAIISFDSFAHQPVTFTKNNINTYRERDGFALFYYAFQQISKKSSIENVIFDITCNGGGDTNALIPMLGFLTRNVEMVMYNPLSKAYGYLSYQVDTNLDGVYDESDSFAGKYNFFVLTSNYTFSCANLFTMVCKNSGLAKIIGQHSGGGACVVSYTCTPDGKPFRISGLSRNGFEDDVTSHTDYGVPVDAEIEDISNYYNDTYLDTFVSSL